MDRIMISGVSSGCGKTTVVCAVLQALVNRGLKTGAFKCGPDYIDPMFHSRIIGAKSANLDLHFFSENTLRFLLAKNAAGCDVSVIEGAMGFYDGAGLTTWKTSAYELALVTKTPVVLVVNARGAALSVLAVIEGFLRFRPDRSTELFALSAPEILFSLFVPVTVRPPGSINLSAYSYFYYTIFYFTMQLVCLLIVLNF